jgi:hypothetical protein
MSFLDRFKVSGFRVQETVPGRTLDSPVRTIRYPSSLRADPRSLKPDT